MRVQDMAAYNGGSIGNQRLKGNSRQTSKDPAQKEHKQMALKMISRVMYIPCKVIGHCSVLYGCRLCATAPPSLCY